MSDLEEDTDSVTMCTGLEQAYRLNCLSSYSPRSLLEISLVVNLLALLNEVPR